LALATRDQETTAECDSALDITTGDGAFLATLLEYEFKNVVGVEPLRAPVQAAAPKIRSLIREEMFRPDSFDPTA
jgi:hypothetical protein